jgi:hypothetical protein
LIAALGPVLASDVSAYILSISELVAQSASESPCGEMPGLIDLGKGFRPHAKGNVSAEPLPQGKTKASMTLGCHSEPAVENSLRAADTDSSQVQSLGK